MDAELVDKGFKRRGSFGNGKRVVSGVLGRSVVFVAIMHTVTIRQGSDYTTAITVKGG